MAMAVAAPPAGYAESGPAGPAASPAQRGHDAAAAMVPEAQPPQQLRRDDSE
jgi:hypothetical protein